MTELLTSGRHIISVSGLSVAASRRRDSASFLICGGRSVRDFLVRTSHVSSAPGSAWACHPMMFQPRTMSFDPLNGCDLSLYQAAHQHSRAKEHLQAPAHAHSAMWVHRMQPSSRSLHWLRTRTFATNPFALSFPIFELTSKSSFATSGRLSEKSRRADIVEMEHSDNSFWNRMTIASATLRSPRPRKRSSSESLSASSISENDLADIAPLFGRSKVKSARAFAQRAY